MLRSNRQRAREKGLGWLTGASASSAHSVSTRAMRELRGGKRSRLEAEKLRSQGRAEGTEEGAWVGGIVDELLIKMWPVLSVPKLPEAQ